MAAIWGLIGHSAPRELELLGRRLEHRGASEVSWTPAPHVRFGWRPGDHAGEMPAPPDAPLMFTGTILNRRELSRRLGRSSAPATARADAELLWDLYRAEGPSAFSLINGQFAVALYDARGDAVVLATDRWSVQPLYLARIGERWAFATEYRALLALEQLEARLDRGTAAFLQGTKYLPVRKCLLAGVRPIAPGERLRISGDQCDALPYGPLKLDIDDARSEEALVTGLEEAIFGAVRRLIEDRDRIGIALSAGLDSTVTLGAVRAVAPRIPIHTYTASFDPDDPDLKLAAEAARYFGTTHREIILAPDDLPRLLPELVWAMEDPVAREEMLVYHVLAQEAAQEVPIVLYGHMADILFGGMPRHLLIKLAGDLPYARDPLVAFYDYTQTGAVPRSILGRLLVAAYYRGRHVPPPHVGNHEEALADARLRLSDTEPLNSALLDAIQHPTEVAAMERLHARAGVPFGSIFHDAEVAQWAFRIPDRLKIRGRCRKYILRRAAERILPPSFASRPKGMIRISQDRRLWRVVEAMAAELLAPRAVAARGLFDPRDVARLLQVPRDRRNRQEQFYRVWTMLLTEIWCRTFIDGRGAMCTLPPNPYARTSWRRGALMNIAMAARVSAGHPVPRP